MSAIYSRGAFELAESDFDLSELLWPVAAATPLERRLILEEAVHFDETQHPRWPKGTPKGGQFIRVGQSFGLKGKQYEVAHVVKGKIYAHLAGGKSAQTIEVKTSELAGFDAKHPAKVQVAQGIEAPTPVAVKGGKGQESTITAVSPYVDHASHDPSIPVPAASPITPEEWKRFGKLDQEHYTELQERFGKWTPGDAKPLVDKAYTQYEASTAAIVKKSYHSQYGSSSGYSLSLVSAVLEKLHLGHGGQLPANAFEEREKAMVLQGDHRAAVQWDLYNRTHSPDVFAVHKTGDAPTWWSNILSGHKRVFSGLSQTFQYRVGGFGSTGVATPLAIRHVLLSSDSALPVQTGFLKEYEISVPEQLVLDDRSVVFTDSGIGADTKAWLQGATNVPRGGFIHDILRNHLKNGGPLPDIPAPANVQMDGQNGKTWIDPEPEAWKDISKRAVLKSAANDLKVGDHFRQGGVSYQVATIDQSGLIHGTEHPGSGKKTATVQPFEEVEIAKPISVSGLNPGDYVMGLQGSRYVVVQDPGDSTYGLRYVEITDGGLTQNAYQLKEGGSRQFFKLDGQYHPTPKVIGKEPAFEPQGWTASALEPQFVSKLPTGSKFKVNGNYYEVAGQLGLGQSAIKDLVTGKAGKINSNYLTHVLAPKSGYKPPPGTLLPDGQVTASYTPQKGDWISLKGEKWEVMGFQKGAGKWRVKRPGKTGIELLGQDDEAFKSAYRPSDYVIGEKQKLRDFAVGEKFHVGAGSKQKPYEVVSQGGAGAKTKVKDLSTGLEHELSRNASYAKLVQHTDDQGEPTVPSPATVAPPPPVAPTAPTVSPEKPTDFDIDAYDKSAKGKNLKGLKRGDIFTTKYGQVYRVIEFQGPKNAKGQQNIVKVEYLKGSMAGKSAIIGTAKIVYPLTPKKPLAAAPPEATPSASGSPFDPSKYELGAPTAMSNMDVGAIVKTGESGPYFKVNGEKQNGQIGVTSMVNGSPGFLPAGMAAQKLVGGPNDAVPGSAFKQGDSVLIEKLKAGDQFTYPGDPNTYAIAVPPDAEWSAMVSHVGDDGSLGPPTSSVLNAGNIVTFHKAAGDATTDWWKGEGQVTETDPGSLAAPPGFAGYGSAYASGAKEKGGFSGKHDKVAEMAPGTVFRDKGGALWKVKSSGPKPIITDGKSNFAVDGSLRGRVALYMGDLPQGDSSPPVGQPGPDYSVASATSLLGPNVGNKPLSDLPVGTIWAMPQSGELYIVTDKAPDGIDSKKITSGLTVIADPNHVPKDVAIPPVSAQPPETLETAFPPELADEAAQKFPVGSSWTFEPEGVSVTVTGHSISGAVLVQEHPGETPFGANQSDLVPHGDGAPSDDLEKAMHAAAAALKTTSSGDLASAGVHIDPMFDAPFPPAALPGPGEKRLGDFAVGDKLHFGVGDWQVEKHGVNAYGKETTWLKALDGPAEGQTLAMPADLFGKTPEKAPDGQALVGNPGGLLLSQMKVGSTVELAPANGGGTWQILDSEASIGVNAKKLSGSLGADDVDAPGVGEAWNLVGHWSPIAFSPGADDEVEAGDDDQLAAALKTALSAVHGGQASAKTDAEDHVPIHPIHVGLEKTLEQIKAAHGGSLAGVPYGEEFLPFKSTYGSGGAYKHPPLSELSFGQKFVDKSGSVYRFVSLTGNNQAIIVSDSEGKATKVPAGLRVKTKGV